MSAPDVSFRLTCDGTQGLAALSQFQGKLKDVGNTARNELAQRLKTVFTVTAIEEVTRRTAEWALQIEQTSKQLGISAEALQTLNLMSQKQGIPQDAVQGLFENVAKAQQEAVKGNVELQWSFQQLGITMDDLRNKNKADIFSQVMKGLPDDVIKSGVVMRNVASNITGGTPENYINAVKSEMGGNTLQEYTNTEKENGNIQSEDNISELSSTWAELKQTLSSLGTELVPIVSTIVSVLNTLALGLKGVYDFVKDIITGDWSKAGSIFVGMLEGLLLTVTHLADGLNKLVYSGLSHLPVIGKYFTSPPPSASAAMENYFGEGRNSQDTKEGRAIGESIGMFAPLGGEVATGFKAVKNFKSNPVSKMSAGEIDKVAANANKTNLEEVQYNIKQGLLKRRKISLADPMLGQRFWSDGSLLTKEESYALNAKLNNEAEALATKELANKQIKFKAPGYGISAGTTVATGALGIANPGSNAGKGPEDTTPILPMSQFQSIGGSKSSTLSMGGIFGSGFQSRIIQLNSQMVDYLAQITKYLAPGTITPGGGNPNAQPATTF